MKTPFFRLIIFLTLLTSCSSSKKNFNPNKKFSPNELKDDFLLLNKILLANHPSLYWYSSKKTIDSVFSNTYSNLNDSLTELEFKNRVSRVLSQIRCGHTAVRSSVTASKYFRKSPSPQFPMLLKVWKDSAVVVANYSKSDSVITRGTIITSINNRSVGKIIDSISQFISTDGFSNNFKYQLISFNFPAYYKNIFKLDSQYLVKYIDTTGIEQERFVKNFKPALDSADKKERLPFKQFTKRQLRKLRLTGDRNLTFDTSLNTAILSVNTFSSGKLTPFFRKSFKQIKENNTRSLIIDLRLNTGGSVMTSTRFTRYLADKPFKVADTVAAINRSFPYKKYIKPWFIYWLNMKISGRRKNDGRIHFTFFEKHYFKPKSNHHFKGDVYLLTGGYTFSAASLVAGRLKGQSNVTVVGEETGGGYYGNTAMHLTTIVLPNTNIRVSLPLFRIVLDKDRLKTGHGVLPDVEVGPSSESIKRGVDTKLEKVKELIAKKQRI